MTDSQEKIDCVAKAERETLQPTTSPFRDLGLLTSVVVVLAILCLVVTPYWWYTKRVLPFPVERNSVDVVIPYGASGRDVASLTSRSGIGVSAGALYLAMRLEGANTIHAGRYRFISGITMHDLVERFRTGGVVSVTLRIPEGVTAREAGYIIEGNEDIRVTLPKDNPQAILQAIGAPRSITSLEGLFAPETYNFHSGLSDARLFGILWQRQKAILDSEWNGRSSRVKLATPYEALILASIIEKETGNDKDRATISSVFHNRLAKKMLLQTDPTVIYGLGDDYTGNLTKADLQRPSPYNTYLNAGLPPTPICLPSRASIHAALQPADTDYYYFVSRGDGTSEFSRNLPEHNRAVQKFILKK